MPAPCDVLRRGPWWLVGVQVHVYSICAARDARMRFWLYVRAAACLVCVVACVHAWVVGVYTVLCDPNRTGARRGLRAPCTVALAAAKKCGKKMI